MHMNFLQNLSDTTKVFILFVTFDLLLKSALIAYNFYLVHGRALKLKLENMHQYERKEEIKHKEMMCLFLP